jgi:hypothetical protein
MTDKYEKNELPKVKVMDTPMTDKKKFEVVNTKKSTEWVFISPIKRNGTLYEGGSVCPKEKLEEMKKLGFVENV